MVPARFQADVGPHHGMIHALIPGVIGLVHHLDVFQVLDAERGLPAGNEQPDRVTLLDPKRLAVLAVGDEHILHRLCDRHGVREFAGVVALGNQPRPLRLDPDLIQQDGQRHAGPLAATRHPVNELDRQPHVRIALAVDHGGAIAMAFQEMNPGDRRQALEIVHGEAQWAIHQAMDREPMFRRIDLGEMGRMVLHEVQLGRRDDPRVILQWRVIGDVVDAHSRAAARGIEMDMYAIGGVFGRSFGLGSASRCPRGHPSECCCLLQELPPTGSIGIHVRLPRFRILASAWPEMFANLTGFHMNRQRADARRRASASEKQDYCAATWGFLLDLTRQPGRFGRRDAALRRATPKAYAAASKTGFRFQTGGDHENKDGWRIGDGRFVCVHRVRVRRRRNRPGPRSAGQEACRWRLCPHRTGLRVRTPASSSPRKVSSSSIPDRIPTSSRNVWATVRNLTSMPVRFVINTEPHADHTTGNFMFSPPAVVVGAAGAGDSMRAAEKNAPDRIQRLAATSPEFRAALEGYRFVPPNIEYQNKMTINLGGKTLELYYLKGVHSEADTAVWLPNERVLFSASAFVVNQVNILRPFVGIPDILAAGKMMKALNPEHVVPGHGTPGTVKIFEDGEKYYALLLERVGAMVKAGKSLDDIKKEVTMPEYASWGSQDRFPTNVEAAYRAVTAK